jgi:hypothetical protein
MRPKNTPQAGSYEASLTKEERIELHSLLAGDESLHEIRGETIPWRDGPDKGTKPSIATLCKIKMRLRTEQMVLGLDQMLTTVRATKEQLAALAKPSDQEQLLDAAMAAIGREVLEKTLEGQDASVQKAVTRLLLKRADQRRFDRRMTLLEAEFETNKKTQAKTTGPGEDSNPSP